MTSSSFFFEHSLEIRLVVALAAIAIGFILIGLFNVVNDVLARLAGSAGKARDALNSIRPSALGTR